MFAAEELSTTLQLAVQLGVSFLSGKNYRPAFDILGAPSGVFNGTINEVLNNSSSSPIAVYQVTVQSNTGALCDSIFNVSVVVNPTPIVTINNETICDGDDTTLTATVTGAQGTGDFTWAPGGQTQNITVSPSTTQVYTCDYN